MLRCAGQHPCGLGGIKPQVARAPATDSNQIVLPMSGCAAVQRRMATDGCARVRSDLRRRWPVSLVALEAAATDVTRACCGYRSGSTLRAVARPLELPEPRTSALRPVRCRRLAATWSSRPATAVYRSLHHAAGALRRRVRAPGKSAAKRDTSRVAAHYGSFGRAWKR